MASGQHEQIGGPGITASHPMRTQGSRWTWIASRGIRVPLIGIAVAVGLALFFIGAVIMHRRARDLSLGNGAPVMFPL